MGEFNVNKSDGSLEQTAGMPSEYPATQVMMSDGVTSVEDLVDISAKITNIATNVTINSAVYKNGLVIIDGTLPASLASGTNIFKISSKYRPIAVFSVPCTRAEVTGGVVYYSGDGKFIYYISGQAYTASSIFHLVYFCD